MGLSKYSSRRAQVGRTEMRPRLVETVSPRCPCTGSYSPIWITKEESLDTVMTTVALSFSLMSNIFTLIGDSLYRSFTRLTSLV